VTSKECLRNREDHCKSHGTNRVSLFQIIEYNAIAVVQWRVPFTITVPLLFGLVFIALCDIESQTLRIQIQLVPSTSLLQDLGNGSRVLDSLQINIRPTLLNSVSNQLCRSCLTLGSNNHSLLLLAGFVNNKCGSLCLLLCNLLCFDSGRELGRECKVLKSKISN